MIENEMGFEAMRVTVQQSTLEFYIPQEIKPQARW